MSKLFFEHALLPGGWARDVAIDLDGQGRIAAVEADRPRSGTRSDAAIAVPGTANLHSHAFQRAMCGLGEWRAADAYEDGSFWTWREAMYRFLGRLRPEDLEAVAAQLYVEMLEAGFTAVGEFHYVHHQPDGTRYDTVSEMSGRLLAAAAEADIGMTLLPVFYGQSGFGGATAGGAQRRFVNDPDRFVRLVEDVRSKARGNRRTVVGIAPHSLRAVTPDSLKAVLAAHPRGPVHIHIAEQEREVEDCIDWSGQRPVEWLFDHVPVDNRWCLVHATHMTAKETRTLAASGAVAGLCPLTEANLGDGIFNGIGYHRAGGAWGVGSDSHIRIDLAEELRALEYSQRLRDRRRNLVAGPGEATGRALFEAAGRGGAIALDQPMGSIAPGNWGDIVGLDPHHPVLVGKSADDWLNGWIFSGDRTCVRDVWVAGRHVVVAGRHRARAEVAKAFARAMEHLNG